MTINKQTYVQLQILSNVGFAINISIQTFIGSCHLALDLYDVKLKSLHLSSLQTQVVGFSFDIMILEVLKPNNPKRNAPHTDVAPSSGGDGDGGAHPDGERKKATGADKNSSQRSAFKLKPGEKYTDFASHRVHCPICTREQEACMKFNIKGSWHQGSLYKHNMSKNEATKFGIFVKAIRAGDF
jgi:hypothetical protein